MAEPVQNDKGVKTMDEKLKTLKAAGAEFIGKEVYLIPKYMGNVYCGVVKDKVQMVGITSRGVHIKAQNHDHNKTFMLGKTAFFDKAEADAEYKKLLDAQKQKRT